MNWNLITGDPGTTSLPHRILNLVVFVAVMAGLFFMVTDALQGLQVERFLFDAAQMMATSVLYGLARFGKRVRLVSHLGALLGLAFCATNYFLNAGIAGPTLLVLLMILTFVTLIHSPRASFLYLLLGLGLILGSMAVAFRYPNLVTPYSGPLAQYVDTTITFLFTVLMMFLVARMVMRFFRETLAQSKADLAAVTQSERMAALGEILANVSHEIRTPLGVIGSSLSLSRDWWLNSMPQVPPLLSALNPSQVGAFWSLLAAGLRASELPIHDTRTQRALRHDLSAQLRTVGADLLSVDEVSALADDLASLQLAEWDPSWTTLLAEEAGKKALAFALSALNLSRSTRNAGLAYNKIATLLRALVTYSRSENPGDQPLPTRIIEGLDMVLTLYAASQKQNFEMVRQYEADPAVLGKADELVQVWTNLVQNALHAMENRGTLTLTVRQEGNWAVVLVSDTGPGVSPEIRDKIFTPFFTTKDKGRGTGLGLGIVSRVVAAHGGTVSLKDSSSGATFEVRLPVYSNA